MNYKKDSTLNVFNKENYYLDISKNDIIYYNRLYFINDSLQKNKNISGFKGYKLSTFYKRSLPKTTYETYEYIGDVNFYKLVDDIQFKWVIKSNKKLINGLNTQLATTNFGGREWEAWFCSDIPFSYGPVKFYGLPGIIVELYDRKENYHFKLIKNEVINSENKMLLLTDLISRSIKIDRKKLNNLKLQLYSNPFKYVLNGSLSIPEGKKLLLDDGTILSKEELKPAEKKERKKIKSFNNPIELNNATIYP